MATTENTFNGNGTTGPFSFTFEYIEQSDVKVSIDGVTQSTTEYTFPTATSIQFTSKNPSASELIRIFRDTDIDTLNATFSPGSAIKAEDLNNNYTQNNYAVQEIKNNTWDVDTETIKSNETWVSNDSQIATTAAIDARFQDEITETIESNETWVSNDDHVATTQSIDNRVDSKIDAALTTDVVAGDSITITDNAPSSGQITISVTPDFGSQNVVTTGTSTAASFIPTSSTVPTNGVYLPSANNVAISTNGTGRLFISDDGKIGIGTSTPSSYSILADDLVIAPSTSTVGISLVASTGCLIAFGDLDAEGRGVIEYAHGDDSLRFSSASSQRLIITSNGDVNIVGAGTAGVTQAVSFNGSAPVDSLIVNSSGNVSTAGTMTADSFIPSSNTVPTNGVYLPFTNTVGIATNSTGKVFIDSGGRLLIGSSIEAGGAGFQINSNRIRIGIPKTPASATDTGTAGEICWDANYIYVCTATNTWKRTALSTW